MTLDAKVAKAQKLYTATTAFFCKETYQPENLKEVPNFLLSGPQILWKMLVARKGINRKLVLDRHSNRPTHNIKFDV